MEASQEWNELLTFNEYAVVSENRVTAIPKNFDLKVASLYGCAITTAFGVINNNSNLKSGESIAVFGAGGVGLPIILAASLTSAYPIIAIDINDFKLNIVKHFGATHIINSTKEDSKNKIQEYVSSEGVDVAVDTTGIKKIRELAYEITNKEGRTILVGVPNKGEKICIDSFPLHFKKKITGSHGGDSNPTKDIPRLIGLQNSGKFDLDKMITKIFSLNEINDAFHHMRTGNVVRCMIKLK